MFFEREDDPDLQDESDMLRYSLVRNEADNKFTVDAESGELFADHDLLAGIHRFNLSVTDGKYHTTALITVDVHNSRNSP